MYVLPRNSLKARGPGALSDYPYKSTGVLDFNVKEQNKLHFEKELHFRQNLTRVVYAAQQVIKIPKKLCLSWSVTHQDVQTTSACFKHSCRYLINHCFDCFEISLYHNHV